MTLVKASILNMDTQARVTCMFNPTDYTFAKSVDWAESTDRGANVPALEFTGGKPASLTLKLFFDTTDTGEDVRTKYTNALWDLAMVNPDSIDSATNKGRPPTCSFEWGTAWSFEAVVTSINTSFTMFKGDGTPVRATVGSATGASRAPDERADCSPKRTGTSRPPHPTATESG